MRATAETRAVVRVMNLRDEYIALPILKALALPSVLAVEDYLVFRQVRGWHNDHRLVSKVCVDGAYANLHPNVVRTIARCRVAGRYEVEDGERFVTIIRAEQGMVIDSSIILNGKVRRPSFLVFTEGKLQQIDVDDFSLLVEVRHDAIFNAEGVES